ncbi:MAG: glycerol-3-phosphate 1-O-acyltransferase PlsY [Terriglobales bacterium]
MFTTIVIGYFLGSIPFGFILVRIFRGEDIRRAGSGNIGATNVARSSPWLGLFTLILDALKGFAAVMLVQLLFPGRPALAATAALFAIVGHMFPIWLRFRGGKGVATGLGSFALLAPKSVLLAITIFAILVLVFRYISLGSIIAVLLFPLLALRFDRHLNRPSIAAMAAASLLIVARHHANIRRLIAGTEPRFRWKRG